MAHPAQAAPVHVGLGAESAVSKVHISIYIYIYIYSNNTSNDNDK